jgi:hypothetical protein
LKPYKTSQNPQNPTNNAGKISYDASNVVSNKQVKETTGPHSVFRSATKKEIKSVSETSTSLLIPGPLQSRVEKKRWRGLWLRAYEVLSDPCIEGSSLMEVVIQTTPIGIISSNIIIRYHPRVSIVAFRWWEFALRSQDFGGGGGGFHFKFGG